MTDPVARFTAVAELLFALKADGRAFGVDRMRAFAEALGHPERRVPVVHVAGTNGKGSVAAMLDAILRAAGWRVGLHTSPHLVHVGERVQVNRRRLSSAEFVAYVDELRPVAERIAAANPTLAPTFFEYITAMALLEFSRKNCDVAVVEVGLGGRLDATNIVHPEVAVITSIGLDHCELLGHDLRQIAAEKAGIIKAGVPVIIGRVPPEAEEVIRATAARLGASVSSVRGEFGDLAAGLPETGLAGEYQRWNAATATLTARALGPQWRLTESVIAAGLRNVAWPGRWERRTLGERTVIFDASHNPEGAGVLDANLRQLVDATGRRPIVLVGVLGRDRAGPLIETICRHAAALFLVEPHQSRACDFATLEALVPASFAGKVHRTTVDAAFPGPDACALGTPDDIVVVTGSIYLLGEVLTRVESRVGEGGTRGAESAGSR